MKSVRCFRIRAHDYFDIASNFMLSILTLDVEQDTGVHRYHQRNVARDTDDGGVVMSSQDL